MAGCRWADPAFLFQRSGLYHSTFPAPQGTALASGYRVNQKRVGDSRKDGTNSGATLPANPESLAWGDVVLAIMTIALAVYAILSRLG